ncbi:hypothetical protein [Nostoc sp.]|uniref:hypothetical protein n=1 Tax=Nostoc sp. TaxID=1180 RepID=UPI002FF4B25C
MSNCYRFSGQGVNNDAFYEYFACGDSPSFQAMEGGQALFLDGSRLGGGGFVFRTGTQAVSSSTNDTPTSGYQTFGNCTACKPVIALYDCINGKCTVSTQYNTPGLYANLTDCQAVCANGGACAAGKKCVDPTTFCPDGKVCIDQGEFDSAEALISKIGSEVC